MYGWSFFRYTHHAMDITMEWGQKMLQGQPPARKAARSTKIHIAHDVLTSGK